MTNRLTMDLRMVRHSGIGRYLRNLVPLLLPQLGCAHIRVLGQRRSFDNAPWLDDPRVQFIEESAAIYSIAEQMLAWRGRFAASDLLWVPHYNVPLPYRGRLIVTMHDIAPVAVPKILGSPIKRAYAKTLIESACSRASAILCVSHFTRDEVRTRLHVAEEKLHVTPLGLDADWPAHAEPHREPDGAPYILFVGNVKPNKNLRLLLDAFRSVQNRVPYRVLLAGRLTGLGTADDKVIADARSFGERVRFVGEVSDVELQRLYAGASALCLPSKYEGFGLPLLEAMALSCPVLCSTAGSLPEVADDAALSFAPDSVPELAACLLQVLEPAAMDSLRLRGRVRVRKFSFATCAAQTATVMNALLEEVA